MIAICWAAAAAATATASAGEIQSLLQRGLPTMASPPDRVTNARAQAYPLKPLVRLPFYGLPYDLVDTTTGRLTFEIEDLTLPGRMPIALGRIMDSGGPVDYPAALPDRFARYGADLGPSWSFTYSDYLQAMNGNYVLAKAEGGPITFVPDAAGATTYHKDRAFPSNHLKLAVVAGSTGTIIDETRADGTVWRFVQSDPTGYYLLSRVTDAHGNFLTVAYQDGYVSRIDSSDGAWVSFIRSVSASLPLCPPPVCNNTGCRQLAPCEYDNYGTLPLSRVTAIQGSAGRSVAFAYDALGRLTQWTDARGRTWTVAGEALGGRPQRLRDPEQRPILSVTYDIQGRVATYATGEGTSTFSYPTGLSETSVQGPRGFSSIYGYNADGITTNVKGLYVAAITLDADNNIATYTAPGGATWSFTHDSVDRLISVTSPTFSVWSYAYDAAGRLSAVTNPRGTTTRFERSAQGDILTEHEDFDSDGTRDPGEPVWSATYSPAGDLLTATTPQGSTFTLTHDAFGQIDTVTLPCASAPCPVVDFDFGPDGFLAAVRRPLSATSYATWTYAHDAGGLLISVVDPTGWTQAYAYDGAGLLTGLTDPIQGARAYAYTDAYRLASLRDALGAVTSLSYDSAGNLTSERDPLGHETTFTYDAANRLASRADPLGRSWSYGRDSSGNVTSLGFPNGQDAILTYDGAGRLLTRSYPDGMEETFTYDPNGNVTSVARRVSGTASDSITMTYDARDLIASIDTLFPQGGASRGVRFEYDLDGNRTATLPTREGDHWQTNYTYDTLGHVTGVSYYPASYSPDSYTYTYDPWTERRTSLPTRGHPNAVRYTGFDAAGRLTQFVLSQGGAATDGTYDLTYDSAGRLSRVVKHLSGHPDETTTYSYDAAGRLIRQVLPDGSQRGLTRDALGRLMVADLVAGDGTSQRRVEYGYSEAGELMLLNAGAGHVDYTYDYAAVAASGMARITRVRSGDTPSTRILDVGYDARIAREFSVGAGGAETLETAYRWYPFATAQLEVLSTRGTGGLMDDRNFVDALGGPAISSVGLSESLFTWYDQAPVIDEARASGLFEPQPVRGLADREEFRLFARRLGFDVTGQGQVALALSGTRTGAFAGLSGLLGALGRSQETPPKLASFGALDDLPSTAYYDSDADALLVPHGLDTPSPSRARGVWRGSPPLLRSSPTFLA